MVGQHHFTRIDRADAVFMLAKFIGIGVFANVSICEGKIFTILGDQEAEDIGRSHNIAVGLANTFGLGEGDIALLLRIVRNHQDVILTHFRHMVGNAATIGERRTTMIMF